ncbi:YkvA family protein [Marinobacter sp. 1Y8]
MRNLKETAKRIKRDALTVYFVARNPETPLFVRLLALAIAAYAMSPIDLIPDFIPVIGFLDDIVLLPLGILLVIKLTPVAVIDASRIKAVQVADRPISKIAAIVVVAIWALCAGVFGYWLVGTANI